MDTKAPSKRHPLEVALTGDAHLRDSQYARPSRGRDFYDAKMRTVDIAYDRGIRVMLDTGDFFNSSRPSAAVIQQATKLDRHLRFRGMVMLSVTGNHDWSKPTWLQTLFPDAEPSDFGIIPLDDRRVVVSEYSFQGVRPYSPSGYRSNEVEIKKMCEGADVVLMHATVNGIVECGVTPDRMLDITELPFVPGLKLLGLGDLHYFGLIQHRGALVGYPGSTEMGSTAEPVDKVMPIIEINEKEATLVEAMPLRIRPFIKGTIRTQQDITDLLEKIKPVASDHPVVSCKFSRDVPEVIPRVFALLDPQRAVIRFEPLPSREDTPLERVKAEEIDAHGIEYFLHARFGGEEKANELALSVDLLARGEEDGANIIAAYIEKRKIELDVRENTPTSA